MRNKRFQSPLFHYRVEVLTIQTCYVYFEIILTVLSLVCTHVKNEKQSKALEFQNTETMFLKYLYIFCGSVASFPGQDRHSFSYLYRDHLHKGRLT